MKKAGALQECQTEYGGHPSVNEQQQRQIAAAALRVEKVVSLRCASERGEAVTGWRRSAPPCRPDITLAREKLDWEPHIHLEEGLTKVIDYFKSVLAK